MGGGGDTLKAHTQQYAQPSQTAFLAQIFYLRRTSCPRRTIFFNPHENYFKLARASMKKAIWSPHDVFNAMSHF